MIRFLCLLSAALLLHGGIAHGGGNYFITIDNRTGSAENALSGYPGLCWGKTADKIYLAGGDGEIAWLDKRGLSYRSAKHEPYPRCLYLCYFDPGIDVTETRRILDSGPGYVVSEIPLTAATFVRRLTLRSLPLGKWSAAPATIVTYDPVIDSLIQCVNSDTVLDCLNKISGASPVYVNMWADTILTRRSFAPDNKLAARFLARALENYGYEIDFQGFYGVWGDAVTALNESRVVVGADVPGIIRTSDGGQSWQDVRFDFPYYVMGGCHIGPNRVWLTSHSGTVLFSSNGGISFQRQYCGINFQLYKICFVDSLEGWATSEAPLVHTTNGGGDWDTCHVPGGQFLMDVDFADHMNGWSVGWDGAIYHTSDGGAHWLHQTSGTTSALAAVDFVDSNEGWALGIDIVLHTTNGGMSWRQAGPPGANNLSDIDFMNSQQGVIVSLTGEIFLTDDGGTSWQSVFGPPGRGFYDVDMVDSLVGYGTGFNSLLKTTDGGWTWVDLMDGVESAWRNIIATKIGVSNPDQQVIVCAHYDDTSEIPDSLAPGADDNGSGAVAVIEMARLLAGVPFEKTLKFCLWTGEEQGLMGSSAYAAAAYARGDSIAGVFNFDMISWDSNADDSAELECGTMTPSQELGNVFMEVISDYGILLTPEILTWQSSGRSDHASFWEYDYPAMMGIEDHSGDFNPFYHTTNDRAAIINENYFLEYVKAGVGVVATFAIPDTSQTSMHGVEQLPSAFTLRQNYPNPFNARTTIEFNLRQDSQVKISIYDISGALVRTLVDGHLAAGPHTAVWDAGEIASGVYYYRLTTEGESQVKKMIMLK